MPHIHTAPNQHDWSVTAFVVRYVAGQPKLLLHPHRKLGTLMPPGGHVELDETPWAALAHELEEESGYIVSSLAIVQPKTRLKHLSQIVLHPQPLLVNSHYIPEAHFHSDLDYLLIAETEPTQPPHEGEASELMWLTNAEIQALPPEKIMSNIQEIADYIFTTLLDSDDFERVAASEFRTDKISRAKQN